jgi:hypothetical protein
LTTSRQTITEKIAEILKSRKVLKFRRRVTTKVGRSIVDHRAVLLNIVSHIIVADVTASSKCSIQKNRFLNAASSSREVGGTGTPTQASEVS